MVICRIRPEQSSAVPFALESWELEGHGHPSALSVLCSALLCSALGHGHGASLRNYNDHPPETVRSVVFNLESWGICVVSVSSICVYRVWVWRLTTAE
ncbi:hypothetical protein BO70DRAFT_359020 [Aspergillus heteromorphus CBS 117.55]|uniref:Uncharacterized protein n=1 Tax=Aspergillus heteromorphus CBS 117.55 TaxID=1448321 RepID=A0A317WVC1_9EURO|nr:uncharacterized protein BO70DRAFT_359020 [Aspergillus heteromorphus CBS 117.55]PWY90025.1 hypothetical protein BO70DRAFT_359020 [Aspergillus heteromorphus CBS 117.55]